MPSLTAVKASNATFAPSYLPVAIFVGGTSGIGQAIARRFAYYTHGNAHIIIVGRNRRAAEYTITYFPTPTSPDAHHEFVLCDVSLMKNVQACISSIVSRLHKVNFLVITAGGFDFKGRQETSEGIDYKLALNYYARWKFTHDLMPLLEKAKDAEEDAKVLTTLAAGLGGEVDPNDFGLRKRYSASQARSVSPTYLDLMFEVSIVRPVIVICTQRLHIQSFSKQVPGVALTHIFPGLVRTPLLKFSHWALRPLNPLVGAILYPVSVSPEECAEYMLYALLEGTSGAYRRDNHGDDIGKLKWHGTDEERKLLWDHTVEEIDRALAA